jgi:hypothetical protein
MWARGGGEPAPTTPTSSTTGPTTPTTSTGSTGSTSGNTSAWSPPDVAADCSMATAYDSEYDGIVDFLQINIYDPFPLVTQVEVFLGPIDTDPLIYIGEWDYDAEGRLIEMREDEDNFNGWNTITTYAYDEDGNVVGVDTDTDADGYADQLEAWTYSPGTNQALTGSLDADADGVVDDRTLFTYDLDGRLVLIELDEDDDGGVDETTTFTYEYAFPNVDYYASIDNDNDPLEDGFYAATFDTEGRLSSWEIDEDGDGISETNEAYFYTEDGDLEQIEGTGLWQGTYYGQVFGPYAFEEWSDYTYEAPGRQSSLTISSDFGYGYNYQQRQDNYWDCP